jgi:hypothetical protein
MEVTTDLMDHIKKSLEGISFGKVTISIDSGGDVVTADVSVENRTRHKLKKREDAGKILKPGQS